MRLDKVIYAEVNRVLYDICDDGIALRRMIGLEVRSWDNIVEGDHEPGAGVVRKLVDILIAHDPWLYDEYWKWMVEWEVVRLSRLVEDHKHKIYKGSKVDVCADVYRALSTPMSERTRWGDEGTNPIPMSPNILVTVPREPTGLGAALRDIRGVGWNGQHCWTAKEMAAMMGVKRAQYERYERGEIVPGIEGIIPLMETKIGIRYDLLDTWLRAKMGKWVKARFGAVKADEVAEMLLAEGVADRVQYFRGRKINDMDAIDRIATELYASRKAYNEQNPKVI